MEPVGDNDDAEEEEVVVVVLVEKKKMMMLLLVLLLVLLVLMLVFELKLAVLGLAGIFVDSVAAGTDRVCVTVLTGDVEFND